MFAFASPRPARPAVPTALVERIRPAVAPSSRLIPLAPAVADLFPDHALRRGSTTQVTAPVGTGAVTLALTLLTAASAKGHWCGVVGLSDPGVAAMSELGIDLRRVVFVPDPGTEWATVTAELFEGMDVVLVHPPRVVKAGAARLLTSRARDRRAALVVLTDRPGQWPEPADLSVSVTQSSWVGIGEGHGRLACRRAEVEVVGRRGATRPMRTSLWLPAREGAVRLATQVGP